jgi:outer membrane biogenesis lipoprotein LolB
MKNVIPLFVLLTLTACANLNNLTPEQRQAFLAQQREFQQRSYEAQMRAIYAIQPNISAGTNCTTTYNCNHAYTHCQ